MAEDERLEEEEELQEEEIKPGFFTALKEKIGKLLSFIIGALIIILIAVGTSVYVSTKINKSKIREIGGKMVVPPPPPYATMDLGEFTVNIRSEDEEPHFIRVRIYLGYEERKLTLQAELGKRRIQIMDKINLIISRKTKEELETPEGQQNLKTEIKEQINQILQSGKIREVYFANITVT